MPKVKLRSNYFTLIYEALNFKIDHEKEELFNRMCKYLKQKCEYSSEEYMKKWTEFGETINELLWVLEDEKCLRKRDNKDTTEVERLYNETYEFRMDIYSEHRKIDLSVAIAEEMLKASKKKDIIKSDGLGPDYIPYCSVENSEEDENEAKFWDAVMY